MQTLVTSIAAHLGEGWSAVVPDRPEVLSAGLSHPDGLHLDVAYTSDWVRDRVIVTARFPDVWFDLPAELKALRTTAAISRGAQTIANQINSHLLPKYRPALDRVRERHQEMEIEHTARLRFRTQVRALLPADFQEHDLEPRYRHLHVAWSSTTSDLSMRINSYSEPSRVDVTLRDVPTDLALQICQLIAAQESATTHSEGASA